MTDWTKTSGANGTMTIRDTGSTVEFYFKAGYSSDWVNGLQFNVTANGSTVGHTINYPTGAPNKLIASVNITTDQTVTFRLLTDTNISGIGGPTTFSHSIDRAKVPNAPTTPAIDSITSTSMRVDFYDGANNGSAINSRQIGYSATTTVDGGNIVSTDGNPKTITGLVPGRRYYFWGRTHNSVGYSAWSGRATAVTLSVPAAPSKPLLSSITATTVDVSWTGNSNGGSPITSYQVGWGTSSAGPTSTATASSPRVVSGLKPGVFYYFWVRAKNAVGYSPWSPYTSHRTVAGAYIKAGTLWLRAIPYIKAGDLWLQAEAWGKSVGTWKKTQ